MLKRRLLGIFGLLVVLLMTMAVASVVLLQRVVRDMERVNGLANTVVEQASRLDQAITAVEIDLYHIQTGKDRHLDQLINDVGSVGELTALVGANYVVQQGETRRRYLAIRQGLPQFERSVGSLATAQDPELARRYNIEALESARELRNETLQIDQLIREHFRHEQSALAERFRWVVFGVALGAMLVIDISVICLLRSASMVLRPVDKLVEATRQFAGEHFDFRARLDKGDEFHELAQSYNSLAERLQNTEQRRMETLSQVALTLNHELNNAIATIELQLELMGRASGGNVKFASCLMQIQDNLRRMSQTVESLKHIRRIVLTDYVAGVKMLDLRQSVQEDPAAVQAAPGQATETAR